MNAQCFIDLFDSTAFRGERRRIYGPARLEARLLGLRGDARVSVRVGEQAALVLERGTGKGTRLGSGDEVDSLATDDIRWLVVQPSQH